MLPLRASSDSALGFLIQDILVVDESLHKYLLELQLRFWSILDDEVVFGKVDVSFCHC